MNLKITNITENDSLIDASEDEKQKMAMFYEANRTLFDEILYDNYEGLSGKGINGDRCVFCTSSNLKFIVDLDF